MKPIRIIALTAVSAFAAVGFADPLRVDAQPLFTGHGVDYRTMAVTLENDGPDAHGMLRVMGNGDTKLYPVDLPQGSRKRLVTTGTGVSYGMGRVVLDTDRGSVYQFVSGGVADYRVGGAALLIGGTQGDLSFIREQQVDGRQKLEAGDLYVSPQDAPRRAAAYAPFNAVVLGSAAVRLDDAAVAALKDYALGGGTLVFLGGRDAETLADRRWSDVLPGTDWKLKTLPAPASFKTESPEIGTLAIRVPASVAPGASAAEGAESVFQMQRGLGLGRVVVVQYSPLDPPLAAWSGRMRAFAPLVRGGNSLRSHQFVEHYMNEGLNGDRQYLYSTSDSGPGRYSPVDPFSTKLPPTSTVFGLLVGYFILVVPASFLVLRKMKRGELAWVTAPLLSLGFAGALFKSAEGLYAAKLSTASQGVVVLQEGQPRAMFYGTSQMFFPKGGEYDLKLQNVDQLNAVRHEDSYSRNSLDGFEPIDNGKEITVPGLEANNLAFREMSFSQRISKGDWFRIDRVDADHVRVENRSPYAFQGTIVAGTRNSAANRVKPGDTVTFRLAESVVGPSKSDAFATTDPHTFTNRDGRIALAGRLTGFRPGPHIGNEVASQSSIDVIAFAQEKMP